MVTVVACFCVSSKEDEGMRNDVNSASERELATLPRIGPATAKKIVAARPYSSSDDLSKAGISAAIIKKIAPLITFGTSKTPTPSRQASMTSREASSRGEPDRDVSAIAEKIRNITARQSTNTSIVNR